MESLKIEGKRGFIHKANKERSSESDLLRKSRIATILRKHFGLPCIFSGCIYMRDRLTNEITFEYLDPYVPNLSKPEFWAQYQINLPDIWVKSRTPQRIIELDGPRHDPLDKKDLKRNENYALGGFTEKAGTYVILNQYEENLPEDEIVPILSKKLLLQPISLDKSTK